MSYTPVNDPPPPDDFHTWARPAGEDCPYCKCCTAALCERAIVRDTACHWEGKSPDVELANCPCWRQGSVARQGSDTDGSPGDLHDEAPTGEPTCDTCPVPVSRWPLDHPLHVEGSGQCGWCRQADIEEDTRMRRREDS